MSKPVLCTSQTRQSTCNIRHTVGLERVCVEGIPLMNCSLSLMCKCGGHLRRITGNSAVMQMLETAAFARVPARTRFAQESYVLSSHLFEPAFAETRASRDSVPPPT